MIDNNYYKQRGSAALATILAVLILVVVAVVYFVIRQPRGANEAEIVSSSAPTIQPAPVSTSSIQKVDNSPTVATEDATEVVGENNAQTEPVQQSEVKVFNITGRNFSFSQKEIRVKQGDRIKIVFTSVDGFHDWRLDEFSAATDRVNTGETTEVEFVADKKGNFEYYCSVGQHRALGMVGKLIVE